MPRPIQFQWNTPPSSIDTAVARTSRMIMAGIAAIAHLTSRTTMDQNGIFTSTTRSEEHTSELQSQSNLVCRLLLEKKKTQSAVRPRRQTLIVGDAERR